MGCNNTKDALTSCLPPPADPADRLQIAEALTLTGEAFTPLKPTLVERKANVLEEWIEVRVTAARRKAATRIQAAVRGKQSRTRNQPVVRGNARPPSVVAERVKVLSVSAAWMKAQCDTAEEDSRSSDSSHGSGPPSPKLHRPDEQLKHRDPRITRIQADSDHSETAEGIEWARASRIVGGVAVSHRVRVISNLLEARATMPCEKDVEDDLEEAVKATAAAKPDVVAALWEAKAAVDAADIDMEEEEVPPADEPQHAGADVAEPQEPAPGGSVLLDFDKYRPATAGTSASAWGPCVENEWLEAHLKLNQGVASQLHRITSFRGPRSGGGKRKGRGAGRGGGSLRGK